MPPPANLSAWSLDPLLRDVFEYAPDAMLLLRADATLLAGNRSAAALFGIRAEEFPHLRLADILDPDDLAARPVSWDGLRAGRTIERLRRYRDRNGRVFPAHGIARMTPDGVVVLVLRTASAIEAASRALAEIQHRARFVADALPVQIWTASAEARISFANRLWVEYTGLGLGATAREWLATVHPDDRGASIEAMREAMAAGRGFEIEQRMRNRAGEYRWMLTRAVQRRDARGALIEWIGTTIDIHQSKLAIEGVSRSELHLALAQEAGHLGSFEVDPATRGARWSSSFERMYGFEAGQMPPTVDAWLERIHPDDRAAAIARREAALDGGRHEWENEYRIIRRDNGEVRWIVSRARLTYDAAGRPQRAVGVNIDITDRRRADAERERLLGEAETLNRVKDEFLATLSHELRTPLNAILGWAEMLRRGMLDPAMTARAYEAIASSAQAQAQLVSDILDVSRVITGKLRIAPVPLAPADAATTAVESLGPTVLSRRVDLHVHVEPGLPPIIADPARIQQVLWNLLANALKFTPSGGRIELAVGAEPDVVAFVVRDSGAGIDPAFLPYVFDRFRQADSSTTRRVGGLGLGLAIVRHLVELHGGSVEARSGGPGQGSEFVARFPVVPIAPERDQPPSPPADAPAAVPAAASWPRIDGLRVMVVEDDAQSREWLAALLARQGASVAVCASVAEAREAWRTAIPDVVLADIGMPVEDGYRLVTDIRARPLEQGGRVPVLALTGYAHPADRARALAAGFDDHLAKPLDPAAVLARVAARGARL